MPRSRPERLFFLTEEVRLSIEQLQAGLRELRQIDAANDRYQSVLLLLASGLERFMKVVLCYERLARTGDFPDSREMRAHGHDLQRLLAEIVGASWPDEYAMRPAVQEDLAYLAGDERLKELVGALSSFADARSGRYYNLEIVCGGDPEGDTPEQAWQRLELEAIRGSDLVDRLGDPASLDEIYLHINRTLAGSLERMLRALARMFTLGGLGLEGPRVQGYLDPFLFLRDEELGDGREDED